MVSKNKGKKGGRLSLESKSRTLNKLTLLQRDAGIKRAFYLMQN